MNRLRQAVPWPEYRRDRILAGQPKPTDLLRNALAGRLEKAGNGKVWKPCRWPIALRPSGPALRSAMHSFPPSASVLLWPHRSSCRLPLWQALRSLCCRTRPPELASRPRPDTLRFCSSNASSFRQSRESVRSHAGCWTFISNAQSRTLCGTGKPFRRLRPYRRHRRFRQHRRSARPDAALAAAPSPAAEPQLKTGIR